ncbi:MAG: trimeric intracellular cation channel family protein [Sulfuricurvum sp.]|uniref:trimeric intracellular cation channel family protein n=1 Tax=Sulfuricurvum sp. TaxID=2025608 RepID=UPI0026251DC8|nr:trimeric intracellular cation channel family protein [Sulfuricurvum sp.]MDD2829214.1 trimeric intracellular cation channel family protein [Sulfuricurvum sp.]MDD4949047.1 trimeric intracellular cation channel family protein [Sulfuricurvum sp.]
MSEFNLVVAADILGIIAFALSGFLVGVRHKLDLLGLLISASITALGGGIVRDVILDRTPFAFNEYYPALTVFTTILIAFLLRHKLRHEIERQWLFVISDTIGLVAFSITGALLAIDAHFNFFGVIILSFLTAVGGGVLRDTMINQVPSVLISDFYGSIALIVAILLILSNALWNLNTASVAIIATLAITLRLLAYTKQWHLPKLEIK